MKVWISYAQFETTAEEFDKARSVFENADKYFKSEGDDMKEEVHFQN